MRTVTLVSGDNVFPLEVKEKDGGLSISLSGEPIDIDIGDHAGGGLSLLLDGRSYEAQVHFQDKQIVVELEGKRFVFDLDEGDLTSRGASRGGVQGLVEVPAPMPGKVVKLLVSPGDTVQSGQGVLLFEAMKMQNEIRSPLTGNIVDVAVQEGQTVESRERLFTVQGT